VHPQLGALADGRGAAAPSRQREGRGPQRGNGSRLRQAGGDRRYDPDRADISGQKSKTLERYLGEPFEYVITVCDAASEACSVFPGAKNRLHWSFEDPSQATGTEEERLKIFCRVRDEIRERIEVELVSKERRDVRRW
jgi:hypothetical protein